MGNMRMPVFARREPNARALVLGVATFALLGAGIAGLRVRGDDVPAVVRVAIVQQPPAGERAVAEGDILALDASMIELYDAALVSYKRNMREHVPIIVSLLSYDGGRLILYRPGAEPLEAARVPIIYQLAKSVSHSSMALYQLLSPHLADPSDRSWQGKIREFRTRCQTALKSLNGLDVSGDDRGTFEAILKRDLEFMDECLESGTFTSKQLESFTRASAVDIGKLLTIAARVQITHWMSVVADWKKLLGKDWERTYAVTNTIYVTRQNNIMFTLLAQFMGEAAIGDRLLLFETGEFSPAPEKMLDILGRIVSDRTLGQYFFKDYYLMDAELLGGTARKVIADEAIKRGMKPLLPPVAPFHSNDWPWKTGPKS